MAEIKNLSKLDAFSALSKIHILTKRDEKKEQNYISKLLFSLVLPDFFSFLFLVPRQMQIFSSPVREHQL